MPANLSYTVSAHPLLVRITHWLNVPFLLLMMMSGMQIYNASPLLDFRFAPLFTWGGWLAGGLLWHFAIMWLWGANLLIYLLYGLLSAHFQHRFLPLRLRDVLVTVKRLVKGQSIHEWGRYNAVQRILYIGVGLVLMMQLLSGLAIWKPVQFQFLAAMLGGYDAARWIHFIGMGLLILFILLHVIMVLRMPHTFLPMLNGRITRYHAPSGSVKEERHVL